LLPGSLWLLLRCSGPNPPGDFHCMPYVVGLLVGCCGSDSDPPGDVRGRGSPPVADVAARHQRCLAVGRCAPLQWLSYCQPTVTQHPICSMHRTACTMQRAAHNTVTQRSKVCGAFRFASRRSCRTRRSTRPSGIPCGRAHEPFAARCCEHEYPYRDSYQDPYCEHQCPYCYHPLSCCDYQYCCFQSRAGSPRRLRSVHVIPFCSASLPMRRSALHDAQCMLRAACQVVRVSFVTHELAPAGVRAHAGSANPNHRTHSCAIAFSRACASTLPAHPSAAGSCGPEPSHPWDSRWRASAAGCGGTRSEDAALCAERAEPHGRDDPVRAYAHCGAPHIRAVPCCAVAWLALLCREVLCDRHRAAMSALWPLEPSRFRYGRFGDDDVIAWDDSNVEGPPKVCHPYRQHTTCTRGLPVQPPVHSAWDGGGFSRTRPTAPA
jgi:hypothetical protein